MSSTFRESPLSSLWGQSSMGSKNMYKTQLTDILMQMIIAHIREVLEDDTGGSEWDLHSLSLGLFPVEDAFHIWALHQKLITVPDSGLQEDPDGERQTVWGTDGQWTSLELILVKLFNYTDNRFNMWIRHRTAVTISGISKLGKIVKLLLWVLGVQRLNYMLKRIFHSCRHPPLCVSTDLKEM